MEVVRERGADLLQSRRGRRERAYVGRKEPEGFGDGELGSRRDRGARLI